MPEIERCWLCHKICERPWNPPDINPEDICRCAAAFELDRFDSLEQSMDEIKEILRETRRGAN